jgi:hypothetical protein
MWRFSRSPKGGDARSGDMRFHRPNAVDLDRGLGDVPIVSELLSKNLLMAGMVPTVMKARIPSAADSTSHISPELVKRDTDREAVPGFNTR